MREILNPIYRQLVIIEITRICRNQQDGKKKMFVSPQNLRKQTKVARIFWKLNGCSFKEIFPPVTSKLEEIFGTGNRIEPRDHDLIEQKTSLDFH